MENRIVGRTASGRVLVELTAEEYMESLPVWAPLLTRESTDAQELAEALERKARIQARQPGKATAAQRRFGHTGKPAKVKLDPRVCVECGKTYQPTRCDQKCCALPCTKAHATKAWAARKKAAGNPTTATLTPEQKQERLALIRKKVREMGMGGRHVSTMAPDLDKPVELERAEREAANE